LNTKILLLALLALGLCTLTRAQNITTAGKEFYVSFMANCTCGPSYPDTTELFLTSTVNTSGTITNPSGTFSTNFTVNANEITVINIPLSIATNSASEVVSNLGLMVTSKDTISLFAVNDETSSSDATNVIQKNALGTHYTIATYPSTIFNGSQALNSAFLIEATEDNTNIRITPSSTTLLGAPAGTPFTVRLNKGQTYYVLPKPGGDLSGTDVTVTNGCKPIAVFSGNEIAFIPVNSGYGDHLVEQLFPVNTLGKQFVTVEIRGRNTSRVKVYASYDNTVVTVDGRFAKTLFTGETYEFETNNMPSFIATSKPAQVMQYAVGHDYDIQYGPPNVGDPTMFTIRPVEQVIQNAVFLSAAIGVIAYHHASVTLRTADAANTYLDGVNIGSLFTPVPGNVLFSTAALNLAAGKHQITNAGGFLAYSYGFGNYQGYGYSVGSGANKINAYFTTDNAVSLSNGKLSVCRGSDTFNVVSADSIVSYTWDFGDGSPLVTTKGNVLMQAHAYPSIGSYVVSLTAVSALTDSCALANTSTTQLTLTVADVLAPAVKIASVPQNPVCSNTPTTFVATPQNGGPKPAYQWKVNGKLVGTNAQAYTYTPQAGDLVTCALTSSFSCAVPATATDSLTIAITPAKKVQVSISTPNPSLCADTVITFTAKSINPGVNPGYIWYVNGMDKNVPDSVFSYLPGNGDVVTCVLTSSNTCVINPSDTSNAITVTVSSLAIPYVLITAAQNPICLGQTDEFSATPYFTGSYTKYQWLVNGKNAGTDSAGFTYTPATGDYITCTLATNRACGVDTFVLASNLIYMQFTSVVPAITISTSLNPICAGTLTTFTAQPVNGGQPSYQWLVNGTPAGTNSSIFSTSGLANNDTVSCQLTSTLGCVTTPQAISNKLGMVVIPLVTPAITIAASKNPVCVDSLVNFTAAAVNNGNAPYYAWQVNGSNVGGNSPNFSSAHLANGDVVTCTLTSNVTCPTNPVANSKPLTMVVTPTIITSLSLFTPDNPVCYTSPARFTATPVNGGSSPGYQWLLNNGPTGTNSNFYTNSSLKNGDIISCRLSSSLACTAPVLAPIINMQVFNLPTVTFNPADTVIKFGTALLLRPQITGNIAQYLWAPAYGLDYTDIPDPIGSPDKTTLYNLAVTTTDGCKANNNVLVTVFRLLEMPTAFTPNGDGYNDKYIIPNQFSLNLHRFSIFNRWGQQVFTTADIATGWDGTLNGQPQSSGTYVWVIEYENLLTKQTELLKGSVVLVR